MIKKEEEKQKAIRLRKQGKTYSEILSVIPVAKSTLSIWFQSVDLSKKQKQKQNITQKRLEGSKRGGVVKKIQRIEKQNIMFLNAKAQIVNISKRDLFLIGIVLYWAEGSKEKEYHPGSSLKFANSDHNMIKLFLYWLEDLGVKRERICFDIYLHENNKYRVSKVIKYWSKNTNFSEKFFRVYFKKNIIKTKRKNISPETYFGVLRVYVKKVQIW